jgi:hypothetical protein
MTKIVINQVHGGFGLSPKALMRYCELKGIECYFYHTSKYGKSYETSEYERLSPEQAKDEHFRYTINRDLGKKHVGKLPNDAFFSDNDIDRDDSDLIKVVEEFGKEANDDYSELVIIEIPDGVDWEIDEYDGYETIHEKHRSWG